IGICALIIVLYYTLTKGFKEKMQLFYQAIPFKRLLMIILFLFAVPLFYKVTNDYVRNDAIADSRQKILFKTNCTYRVIPKTERIQSYASLDSLVLVDNFDGKFYFIKDSSQLKII